MRKKRGRPTKNTTVQEQVVEHEQVGYNNEGVVTISEDEYSSEELHNGNDSEEEVGYTRSFPSFKMCKDMTYYKWEFGLLFSSKEEFKSTTKTYAIHSGMALKFNKNDKLRVVVDCKERCDWMACCRKLVMEDTWQLRKVNDSHNCCREYRVKILSAAWLSNKLQTLVKENPKLMLSDICDKA